MKSKPGEPAFPTKHSVYPDELGMDLRDYFAGQALAGILASGKLMVEICQTARELRMPTAAVIADNCYENADAMIAERDKHAESD